MGYLAKKTGQLKSKLNKKYLWVVVGIFLGGLVVSLLVKNWSVEGTNDFQMPIWLVIVAFFAFFWVILYFIWKAKNWLIEWVLSLLYGFLVMGVLFAMGYDFFLAKIAVDWLRVLVGSFLVGGGSTFVAAIVKVVLSPLFKGLKKTHLLES